MLSAIWSNQSSNLPVSGFKDLGFRAYDFFGGGPFLQGTRAYGLGFRV